MKTIALLLSGCMCLCAAQKVLVYGHRGARMVRPENTIPAFEYAIEAGADALELDVWVTKDGVVVVSHDAELHAPICTGPGGKASIRTLTLSEVQQWDCGATVNPSFPKQVAVAGTRLPTLDEVLRLADRGAFTFLVEIKISAERPELAPSPEEFAKLVADVVRRRGLEKRVVVQSFDFRPLAALQRIAPEIPTAALYGGAARPFAEIARESGSRMVAPYYELVTKEAVSAAHQAGLRVVPWTVNTPEEWERLVAAGVDGIITDDPAALGAFLRQRGRH
jgi:glycerophosphoryl diester phosphodiesterase